MTESELIDMIEAYAKEHNKIPRYLIGSYDDLSPIQSFTHYGVKDDRSFYLTMFGSITCRLDNRLNKPELTDILRGGS